MFVRLAVFAPWAGLVAVHVPALGRAWRGETFLGDPLHRSEILYTHAFAFEAAARFWEPGSVAVQTRALNVVDLLGFVAPFRFLVPGPVGFVLLHLTGVALAMAGGLVLARALGTGALGGAAAAAVAGGSALVLRALEWGQYQQALVIFPLVFLAGLWRTLRGERGGIAILVAGGALSLLGYWLAAVYLSIAALLLLPAASPGWLRRVGIAAVAVAVLVLPAAWPVIELVTGPDVGEFRVRPWGSPLVEGGRGAGDSASIAVHELDAVPLSAMFSPIGGWFWPPLPLAIAGILALRDPRTWPWAGLLAFAAVMALGPRDNPIYQAIDRWYPLASRMYHPNRWMTVGLAGGCAVAAMGVARLTPRWGAVVVIGGVLFLGTRWPLREAPWPQAVEEALAPCERITYFVPGRKRLPGQRLDDLGALAWKPAGRGGEEEDGADCVVAASSTVPDWPRGLGRVERVEVAADTLAGREAATLLLWRRLDHDAKPQVPHER